MVGRPTEHSLRVKKSNTGQLFLSLVSNSPELTEWGRDVAFSLSLLWHLLLSWTRIMTNLEKGKCLCLLRSESSLLFCLNFKNTQIKLNLCLCMLYKGTAAALFSAPVLDFYFFFCLSFPFDPSSSSRCLIFSNANFLCFVFPIPILFLSPPGQYVFSPFPQGSHHISSRVLCK